MILFLIAVDVVHLLSVCHVNACKLVALSFGSMVGRGSLAGTLHGCHLQASELSSRAVYGQRGSPPPPDEAF